MTNTTIRKILKKGDLAAKITSAAETPIASNVHARFESAAKTLAIHPTGYSEAKGEGNYNSAPADPVEVVVTEDGRKIYFARIAMDLIDPNPYNARQVYQPERIAMLATSIADKGQLVPGLGTMRNGRCICVAGNYRHKAIRKAGKPTMDFMIHEDLTDRELYELSYKENEERSEQSALDNALVWRDLIADGLYPDESSIADALGLSLPSVNKTMSILKLPNSVVDIIRETPGSFAMSALYELYQLSNVAEVKIVEEMCIKLREGEVGRRECAELRSSLQSHRPRKTKESSRQYKIHKDGLPVGVLKEWDSGKVAFEIKVNDPTERAKLVSKLKEHFNLGD